MNKIILITLLSFSVMFLIGCETTNEQMTPNIPDNFELANFVDYEINNITTSNEITTYNLTVTKPTPCHEILVEEIETQEAINVYMYVGLPADANDLCTQVVSPQTITGSVESTNVNFYVNNELVNRDEN